MNNTEIAALNERMNLFVLGRFMTTVNCQLPTKELLKRLDGPISACWYLRNDGLVGWNLYSSDIDISQIARQFNAAGSCDYVRFETDFSYLGKAVEFTKIHENICRHYDFDKYECADCRVHGVRMYRTYQIDSSLRCTKCTYERENRVGYSIGRFKYAIGSSTAAIPCGKEWWSYDSDAEHSVKWWEGLEVSL